MPPPTVEPNPQPPPDATTLRSQAIAALHKIIYTPEPDNRSGCLPLRRLARPLPLERAKPTSPVPPTAMDPAHDPVLRRRTEAVELLGRFDDPAAVQVLDDLLLRGRHYWAAPVGQWLHDTALLTLLQSPRLPAPAVNRTLRRTYSFLRHPWPWQWSTVYDDLPLLQRYHKLDVFFGAFWIWPVLIFALPLLISIAQKFNAAAFRASGDVAGIIYAQLIVYGTGIEIYLIHQVTIALLAGLGGPPLRVPAWFAARWKGWMGAGLTVLALWIIFRIEGIKDSGCATSWFPSQDETSAPCEVEARGLMLLLPLLLLPIFILAHDLEAAARYSPETKDRLLRLQAILLRRTTDLLYILAIIPGFTQATISQQAWDQKGWAITYFAYIAYLFAVPLLTTSGLRLVTRILAR